MNQIQSICCLTILFSIKSASRFYRKANYTKVKRFFCFTLPTIAQSILDARAKFPDSTLAKLYNPVTMPPELVAAHRKLDKAVDAAYGKKSFVSEAERVAFLFERYQQLVNRSQPAKETTNAKDSV